MPVDWGQGPAYWQEPWPQVQVSSYVLTSPCAYQWLGLSQRMNWLEFPGGNTLITPELEYSKIFKCCFVPIYVGYVQIPRVYIGFGSFGPVHPERLNVLP